MHGYINTVVALCMGCVKHIKLKAYFCLNKSYAYKAIENWISGFGKIIRQNSSLIVGN